MDLSSLSADIGFYFQQGLAPSTRRSYQAAYKRFHSFCVSFNVTQPFPITEQLLCSYATHLDNNNLSPQTIKSYLSAVQSMQISLGLPDPHDSSSLPTLKRVVAGIARVWMLRGPSARARLSVMAIILHEVHALLAGSQCVNRKVMWAVACKAFFGFFHVGELLPESQKAFSSATHLAWGDVSVDDNDNPSMIQIHLKKSKCDQAGKGVDVVVGQTDSVLCPVTALLTYIEHRKDSSGPFFLDTSGLTVTKAWFVQEFRKLLQEAGFPESSYSGHSFRIGAATTAAVMGLKMLRSRLGSMAKHSIPTIRPIAKSPTGCSFQGLGWPS